MNYGDTLLADAKEFVNDWGIPMTCPTGEVFRVMASDASVQQTLDAGGFVNQTSFNLRSSPRPPLGPPRTGTWEAPQAL